MKVCAFKFILTALKKKICFGSADNYNRREYASVSLTIMGCEGCGWRSLYNFVYFCRLCKLKIVPASL